MSMSPEHDDIKKNAYFQGDFKIMKPWCYSQGTKLRPSKPQLE